MSESEDKSPYGPGFIASCVVVGAVLVCGIAMIVTGGGSSRSAAGSTSTAPAAIEGAASDGQDGADSATQPVGAAQPDGVATPAPGTGRGASSCGLRDGDQGVPSKAPTVDGWDVSRKVVVPRSAAFGPAKTDADGFRRCFAHSPTGALYAAYNTVAALADQGQAIPTVKKLMIPGASTDALIEELRRQPPSTGSAASQVAGFRILDADHDRATIMLALPVESEYMSATFTLVWQAGDWKVRPPQPGNPVGAPFSQLRNLNDFVAWSGV
ncbi:hypothetical protein ACWF0M_29095 [Kribbella sp. NPDC055110]